MSEFVPPRREVRERALDAAIAWLCRTHDATGRRGSSKGFSLVHGWQPASPEATGHLIRVLLAYESHTDGSDFGSRAQQMGDWAIGVQSDDGAVAPGFGADEITRSAVFSTGMVIHGWLDLYEAGLGAEYLEAASRGGRFLVRDLEDVSSTDNALVSWALLRLAEATGDDSFPAAAQRRLEWVLSMEQDNGWFDRCSSRPGMEPTTDGIACTLAGLLESYAITQHERYLQATLLTSEILIKKLEVHGRLWGTFDRGWKPGSHECLTGTSQMGAVWLRLYEVTDDVRFLNAALKVVDHAARHQTRLHWAEVRGALPGSHPIYRGPAALRFPTSATNFLVEGLMKREALLARTCP